MTDGLGAVFMRGDVVTLHPADAADPSFHAELVNHPGVWPMLGQVRPETGASQREWIDSLTDDDETVHLVIGVDGEPVGTVGCYHRTPDWGLAELAYRVHPSEQGNGYATDAARRVVRYAFEELRLHKLKASTFEHNEASQRVLERVGFEHEGTFRDHVYVRGEYRDAHRYGLLREEFEAD